MSDVALEMDHVFKKFKKGEIYDALRDFIPALANRIMKGGVRNSLNEHEFWALQDISFQVNRGKCFGIIGPNGAGKSTVLKLLCGIMKPTKGYMRVNGTLSALIEVGAGFHQDLTGRANIYLNGIILGMKKKDIDKKFDEIVEFSGVREFIDTPVKRYSSGMYARLGFSVAAHVEPDVLIVDEVLSVGDILFQNKCVQKMKEIKSAGDTTIIFVSHNLESVAELCDTTLLLERGECMEMGPTNEVINSYLNRSLRRQSTLDNGAAITSVRVGGMTGESLNFQSGEKAWIDIEVASNAKVGSLGLSLVINDEHLYNVFNTSTYRLGKGTFSIEPEQTLKYTFEVVLHLAPGTYYLGVVLYKYDVREVCDEFRQAATLIINTDRDVRGVVNLYPEVYGIWEDTMHQRIGMI